MLVCFLACSWCKGRDGSSAVIFKGKGQYLKEKENYRKAREGSPFSRLRWAAKLTNPAGYNIRQCSVTMAASRTYPDPLWFSLHNHGQLQQSAGPAHISPWRPDVRVHGLTEDVEGKMHLNYIKDQHISENNNILCIHLENFILNIECWFT